MRSIGRGLREKGLWWTAWSVFKKSWKSYWRPNPSKSSLKTYWSTIAAWNNANKTWNNSICTKFTPAPKVTMCACRHEWRIERFGALSDQSEQSAEGCQFCRACGDPGCQPQRNTITKASALDQNIATLQLNAQPVQAAHRGDRSHRTMIFM